MTRQINDAGLNNIKDFEGKQLTVYRDIVGFDTVGYGHKVLPEDGLILGDKIEDWQADDFLKADLLRAREAVESLVKVDLNDNQFGALVSLVYNIGATNFAGSTLLRFLNAGNYLGAADQFQKWVYAGHEKSTGLERRRDAEKALFLTPAN